MPLLLLRLAFFCAGLNPVLAGLPHLLEYAWHYRAALSTAWHQIWKRCRPA
ncbi:hypothetical protein GJA_2205 [Janthinobacterium agaricidamnosum NBRC 102515 = DSM 9628]|uniref:Uncharacterized protein n=1 Tax=Janthinobacterium agaricidamnosum NBRC 102515 = DSM 9628 TaxID=1349767 RepID=W0V5F2_9BURK|nr:hypothetical protein GJA_2205 [Janthinobacterium agaricidamnosum NBRC 102515 = DSM 9628]